MIFCIQYFAVLTFLIALETQPRKGRQIVARGARSELLVKTEQKGVESKGDAVAKATAYIRMRVSPSVAQYPQAMLRFRLPLIEPDMRFSRIRLAAEIIVTTARSRGGIGLR
jgi:hypothetical protein